MEQDLGEARFEFRPLPASPMAVALLIILSLVALTAIPAWLFEDRPYGPWWIWTLPALAVLASIILARPGPMRLYERGLELSLPLWRRALRSRRFYLYDEVRNVYPRLYYVSGALMSPFAASVGTVEHLGLGLELQDGRKLVLKFTPGVPRFSLGREKGYEMAVQELEEVFRDLGRPWVTDMKAYSEEELDRMKRAAARPVMPFSVIVLAFFSPVAIVPLLYSLLRSLGALLDLFALTTSVIVGISPTLAMLIVSWARSRWRHHYLRELSKFDRWRKDRAKVREAT